MCITDDIFGTVLSLYMHDSSQSLPTSEEVLICTSDTTAEEVGIVSFLKCAFIIVKFLEYGKRESEEQLICFYFSQVTLLRDCKLFK